MAVFDSTTRPTTDGSVAVRLAHLEEDTDDHEARIRALEQVRFRFAGVIAGAAAAGSIVAQIAAHFLKG